MHSPPTDPRIEAVLKYWFATPRLDHDYYRERNALWFGGAPETDEFIRQEFERDVTRAARGELRTWESTPQGTMALIILLDQFSLNLYREKPRSYLQSEMAIPLTKRLLAQKLDRELSLPERVFLLLPLEHSENLADQDECVGRFRMLLAEAPAALKPTMENYLDYAIRHQRVVKRFGRFPDRNEVFGRSSSPEELAFLNSSEAPF